MTERDEIRVGKALQGLGFPATKDQVLAYAGDRSADERTLRALKALPDRSFGNTEEVESAVPHKPDES